MTEETQEHIFLKAEGDRWFERNKSTLSGNGNDAAIETIKRVLSGQSDRIRTILEVGCGNGQKLANLGRHLNAECFGLDPSSAAVADGKQQFSNIDLQVGTASKIPFEDGKFDFVYFGFCLYLVDRSDLLKAVSEADRVLKSGGFLAVLDFDPAKRHKREYHHHPGLYSYKTSYSDFFTAGGHYYLVDKHSFSHTRDQFSEDSNERISISVMYKEVDAY